MVNLLDKRHKVCYTTYYKVSVMNQCKPVYIYTTMTGNEEQDTAFFKRLDETGIRWRGGGRNALMVVWR